MKQKIYQVDAFTDTLFKGNPAAVCILENWIPDKLMQQIAAENNLAETAFAVPGDNVYELRWFTPKLEVDLCGHATLATAYVLFNHYGAQGDIIRFSSPRSGDLSVKRSEDGWLTLDFPKDTIQPDYPSDEIIQALGKRPFGCYKGKTDYLYIYEEQEDIEELDPDFFRMSKLDGRGVIVSAPGRETDFVSRFFAPQAGINEDPVTGSAHTTLAPYWAEQLIKTRMTARQLSERGGYLKCEVAGNRVYISGQAVLYLTGEIELP
ncbi:PhzF family phenazine biosynthesis protein [Zeaxanthinibacter enoshimensis]|uniref:PhzF family phenazine biosynthesis protein n=1 Tax=Zeaxanthinibacter enoshimensis TaxID=392009 RepID=UPI003566A54B